MPRDLHCALGAFGNLGGFYFAKVGRVCHFTNITTTNRHQDNHLVLIGVTRHVLFGFIKALDISRGVLAFYFFCNERIGGISRRASLTIH